MTTATVNNEVVIDAPLEKIFNYVSQPSNLLQIWPSLVEITNLKLLPNGGYSYQWKYKVGGIHFSGKGECIEYINNLWLISRNTGAFDSTVTFTFRAKGNQTKVTLTIDYQLPLRRLTRLGETIILKMKEKEAKLIMDNLRIIFEQC